uniref:Uncharacterized protein n=1 Tax=Candidatus Methanogaster sp. ANME-2c ERB4 TaxID=2759911 RepID=A0A7G9Y6R1_9EURY|nr:hypothetical protein FICJDHNH_00035 [Methanosarcinales archaeon ANME-2c ERB4]QNO43950.1 hypothetical protein AECFJODE_00003 [Methanosarcinales archaeon ANME-2c ERB4]QNO50648.1 hypothetical protein BCJHFGCD_00002 [Methanosarcinales archaeon ANME-2c ERB4]
MHIPADPCAVRKILWNAAHQLECKRLLHLFVTIDGWRDRCNDFFVDPWVFTEFYDLFFLFRRNLDLCKLFVLRLDRDRVEYDIKERALSFTRYPLVRPQDSCNDHMIPGRYDPCDIILTIDVKCLRLFAPTHVLRRFLYAQFLGIHKLRFSKFYLKRSFSPAPLVFAHIRLHKPTAGLGHEHGLSASVAFECRDKQSRAHLGRHAHKPIDSDQFRDVDAPEIPYLHLLRDVCDPQMCACKRLLDR